DRRHRPFYGDRDRGLRRYGSAGALGAGARSRERGLSPDREPVLRSAEPRRARRRDVGGRVPDSPGGKMPRHGKKFRDAAARVPEEAQQPTNAINLVKE